MIKDKLMKALRKAAEYYNGGMSANSSVSTAAEESDLNEKQAERLTEMFNTAAAINQEKSASDPTGACELADKKEVIRNLMGGCSMKEPVKEASSVENDYSFYFSEPTRSNPAIDARSRGAESILKSASCEDESVPDELKVSQRSLSKVIFDKIDLLKSAASAADDVVRNLRISIESDSIKIAKEIESPYSGVRMADMFKAACKSEAAVRSVSEYSTKVAESDGGEFSKMSVFDSSPVDALLKIADEIDSAASMIPEYEAKRDFYSKQAEEAENEMMDAVGLLKDEKKNKLSDMFVGIAKTASPVFEDAGCSEGDCLGDKIGKLVGMCGEVSDEDIEKAASLNFSLPVMSKAQMAHGAFMSSPHVDDELKRMLNVRRSVILADLMTNDPIIRDADPNTVVEAYKTMVMSSPRVSLDKAQARAFLRSAVNSVAISPSDVKVITDVDKGTLWSNVDDLTRTDSSIKDSNV